MVKKAKFLENVLEGTLPLHLAPFLSGFAKLSHGQQSRTLPFSESCSCPPVTGGMAFCLRLLHRVQCFMCRAGPSFSSTSPLEQTPQQRRRKPGTL